MSGAAPPHPAGNAAESFIEQFEAAAAEVCGQLRVALGRYPFDDVDADPQSGADTQAGPPPATRATGHDDIDDDTGHDDGHDTGEAPHPDDPGPVKPNGRNEFWSFVNDPDGTWRAAGRLDPDHGQIVDAALREIADALFRESGRAPSGAEILTEMARRSLDSVPDRSRRDRSQPPTTTRRPPVATCSPATAVAACPAAAAAPGSTCTTSSTVTTAARTTPGNLVAVCPHHHRSHHRGCLGIAGDADDPGGLTFTDQHGRPLAANRLIRPPDEPPPPRGSYRHPLGERLQRQWVYFNPPPTRPTPSRN